MQLRGYIPVGWYPSAIVATDNDHLLVANAKGTTVRNPNNYPDPNDTRPKDPHETHPRNIYVLNVLHGNVCSVQVPKADDLANATQQVIDDLKQLESLGVSQVDVRLGAASVDQAVAAMRKFRDDVMAKL